MRGPGSLPWTAVVAPRASRHLAADLGDDQDGAWRFEAFCRSLTSVSDATVTAYRSDLLAFAEWAGRAGIDHPTQVQRLTLRRYLAFLTTTGKAKRTIARRASSLRRYFHWALRERRISADPTVRLTAARQPLRRSCHLGNLRPVAASCPRPAPRTGAVSAWIARVHRHSAASLKGTGRGGASGGLDRPAR